MISHLLIPTDFSSSATDVIDHLDVFYQLGARQLTLLHVRHVSQPTTDSMANSEYCEPKLEKLAGQLRELGWKVDPMTTQGRPATGIVAVADELDVDLIVLANNGHSAASEVLLGSVSAEVLERCSKPVYLYSSSTDEPLTIDQPILHPTDFSAGCEAAEDWVKQLVGNGARDVLLLHVLEPNEIEESMAQISLKRLRGQLLAAGADTVETRIIEGRPKKVVRETVVANPDHFVVMGSQGRGWLGDLMFGGVARMVARLDTHHVLFAPDLSEGSP